MSYPQALEFARIAALESLVHTMRNADTWAERRRAAIAVLEAPQPTDPEPKAPPSASPAQAGEVAGRMSAALERGEAGGGPPTPSAADNAEQDSPDPASPNGLGPIRPDADEPHGHAHHPLDHLDVSASPNGQVPTGTGRRDVLGES